MTTLPAVHVRHEDREGGVVAFVTLDNARRLNVMNTALMEGSSPSGGGGPRRGGGGSS
jgi:enoyl-CoA hydratase/carnithine racemase